MSEEPKLTDKELADALIGHLAQPCETAEGLNLRQTYIQEAQRALDLNVITDPIERQRMEDALRMAQLFSDVEEL